MLEENEIAEASILYPLAQLPNFKELCRMCLKDAKTRLNDLTKSATLTNLVKEIELIVDHNKGVSDTSYQYCLARATEYACTLTRPHPDIDRFSAIVDSILNYGGMVCQGLDCSLGKFIESMVTGEPKTTEAEQILFLARNWRAMSTDNEAFVHRQDCSATLRQYDSVAEHRLRLLDMFRGLDLEVKQLQTGTEAIDEVILAGVMAKYGDFMEFAGATLVPVSAGVLQQVQAYKAALNIDAMARKLYNDKLLHLQQLVRCQVERASADVDLEDDVAKQINLDSLVRLASWSETPHFDKGCLALLTPAMFLICNQHGIKTASSGIINVKKMSPLLQQGYCHGAKLVIDDGADAILPKLTFLAGNAELAKKCFLFCHQLFQHVGTCVQKVCEVTRDAIAKSKHQVDSVLLPDIEDDADFLDKFKLKECQAARRQLSNHMAKGEILEKSLGLDVGMRQAAEVQTRAKVAINRFALASLLARPNIGHETKGLPLRQSLMSVWSTVVSHELVSHFSNEFVARVEKMLPKESKEGGKRKDDGKEEAPQPKVATKEEPTPTKDSESAGPPQPKKRKQKALEPPSDHSSNESNDESGDDDQAE